MEAEPREVLVLEPLVAVPLVLLPDVAEELVPRVALVLPEVPLVALVPLDAEVPLVADVPLLDAVLRVAEVVVVLVASYAILTS